MPQHLRLGPPLRSPTRRARGNQGPQPPTRQPRAHADELQASIREPDPRPPDLAGIDPDRVFKFRGAGLLVESALRGEGLEVLGENIDWVYFVLSDEDARHSLDATLDSYGAATESTPFIGSAALRDTINMIETIEPYGPDDRLDPVLGESSEDPIEVDIRLWPSATTAQALDRIGVVRAVVAADNESSVLAVDDDPESTIVVASMSRDTLTLIADTSVVEKITPPLSMTVTPTSVAQWDVPNGEGPQPAGAAIGIIDDGVIVGNPLLDNIILADAAFPAGHVWNPPSGHGVAVGSLAGYFDFEDVLRGGSRLRTPHPLVFARVVEPDPSRPSEVRPPPGTIYERSLEEAIRWLAAGGVRVVNLSISAKHAAARDALPSPHTALLDRLVSELDLVIVVAAGNLAGDQIYGNLVIGQHAAKDYPAYLRSQEASIAEPGVAASVVTVGSIAHHDAPATHGYAGIANEGHPSPFGRTGVDLIGRRLLKPDFVHWGGNWAWNEHLDTIHFADAAVSSIVASAAGQPALEPGHNGTSFAAPRIAHVAAEIATTYPDASANLIRALLAVSARPATIQPGLVEDEELSGFLGLGSPRHELALESGGNRAVLIDDGELDCNTTQIHRIDIPEAFATGRSRRRIRIALAYDPPVRRQRRDYTAGVMSVALLRAVDEAEALAIFQRQPSPQQRRADPTLPFVGLPQDRRRMTLAPSSRDLGRSTLLRTEWTGVQLKPDDGNEYYLAVTHSKSAWSGLGDYQTQRYGIAIEVIDEGRVDLPLYDLIAARLQARAAAHVRIGQA